MGDLLSAPPAGGSSVGNAILFSYSAPFKFSLCIHLVWGVVVCGDVFVCAVLVLVFVGLWGFLLFVRLFLGLVFGSGFII